MIKLLSITFILISVIVNAQKVRFKRNKILVNKKEFLTYEKGGTFWAIEYDLYEINSKKGYKHFMNSKKEIVSLIHDEFGKEEFLVSKGTYNLIEVESDLWEFTIYFETKGSLIRVSELEEAISEPNPYFEATVVLDKYSLNLNKGVIIEQVESWDENREEILSNVYYFEHASIENLKIEILKSNPEFIEALISGRTLINGSNGNKPDTTFKTTTINFKKDKNLERSVM